MVLPPVFFDRAVDAVSYAGCTSGPRISAEVLGAGDGARGLTRGRRIRRPSRCLTGGRRIGFGLVRRVMIEVERTGKYLKHLTAAPRYCYLRTEVQRPSWRSDPNAIWDGAVVEGLGNGGVKWQGGGWTYVLRLY